MTGLKFNIHIAEATGFDERSFENLVQRSIDSGECGLKTISVRHIGDQPDPLGRVEKIYECRVEIQGTKLSGIEPRQLIFGALWGDLYEDSTIEFLGTPAEEMEYFG